jgi:uncharacterized cofD-like protein
MEDGDWIEGETEITGARRKIRRLHLKPADAQPLSHALEALNEADIITVGPGSLYTSLIPNLLVGKITDAVRESRATKIYIQNIMTQPGETDALPASEHLRALSEHCGGMLFSKVLLNSGVPSDELLQKYQAEGAQMVTLDREKIREMGYECVERNLLAQDVVIRHDPDRLARAVYEIADY